MLAIVHRRRIGATPHWCIQEEEMIRNFTVAALLMLVAMTAEAQDRVKLEVYSTLEVENLNDFKKAFEAQNRDVEILWNRHSTGVITARVLAAQGVQRGAAIWALAC